MKKTDIRRLEILHAAEELFDREGYEKTTVESIIQKAGIAKGTFYYYFKAKKDILNALADHILVEMVAYYDAILKRDNLTPIQKFELMLRGSEKKKIVSSSILTILHKPENRELQEKTAVQIINILAPFIAKVLEKGKQEGFFVQLPSLESIQIVLAGCEFILNSSLFSLSIQKRALFLKSAQNIFELLVGVRPGTFHFISVE